MGLGGGHETGHSGEPDLDARLKQLVVPSGAFGNEYAAECGSNIHSVSGRRKSGVAGDASDNAGHRERSKRRPSYGGQFPTHVSNGMCSMKTAKQIVFRYNGDPTTDEIDLDMDGDRSIPKRGGLVDRKGERWKVVQVNVERNATEPFEVPTYRVFLSNEP